VERGNIGGRGDALAVETREVEDAAGRGKGTKTPSTNLRRRHPFFCFWSDLLRSKFSAVGNVDNSGLILSFLFSGSIGSGLCCDIPQNPVLQFPEIY
jgi:hypothetical protein